MSTSNISQLFIMPPRKPAKPKPKPTEGDPSPPSKKQKLLNEPAFNPNASICPFCINALHYKPVKPSQYTRDTFAPHLLEPIINGTPTAYVILRTPHVMAFLDIQPLVRGHVLVCPVEHTRVGNGLERTVGLSTRSAAEVSANFVLNAHARAVLKEKYSARTSNDPAEPSAS